MASLETRAADVRTHAAIDARAAYRALQTHDARFDGRLFVGVTSTRIYCRPVCRVRVPLERHCRFFANAASAEQEGFRPCRRCRPELAPGLSLVDSSQALAHHAARLVDRAARDGQPLAMPALARRLGVTDRHLRRIFVAAHGVSPLAYLTTQRLLFAKQLLTDTRLPISQVAALTGFGSVRRFNAAFADHYRLAPGDLRRDDAPGPRDDAARAVPAGVCVRLGYRPPYDIDGLLRFFARRALSGVEAVELDGRRLTRTLVCDAPEGAGVRPLKGWIAISFHRTRHEVQVELAEALVPVLGRVVRHVRHALDLDADPDAISAGLRELPLAVTPGLRLPGSIDAFETLVRVILGQQVTVAAARTLAQRLVERFGLDVTTPFPAVARAFPQAAVLARASDDSIGSLGIVGTRIRAIKAVATAVARGDLDLAPGGDPRAALDALRALPGIGEWTAQLVALRVFAWPDAFPASDLGVLRALKLDHARDVEMAARSWQPWRAYATMQLWQSLETGP